MNEPVKGPKPKVGEVEYIMGEPQVWTGKNWVMADQYRAVRPSLRSRLARRVLNLCQETVTADQHKRNAEDARMALDAALAKQRAILVSQASIAMRRHGQGSPERKVLYELWNRQRLMDIDLSIPTGTASEWKLDIDDSEIL